MIEHRARELQFAVGLIGILIFATAMRFWQIARLPLWLDECCSVLTVTAPEGILANLRHDTNPPFYFALLKAWTWIFGIGEAGVRSLSAVAGLLQLAALSLWTRELTGRRAAGLWAAALGALAPLHLHYSQEARGYAVALLLVTLMLWAFCRAMSSGRKDWWAIYAACLLLALYTNDLAISFVPALFVVAAVWKPVRSQWLKLIVSESVVAILYLPCFIYGLQQSKLPGLEWIMPLWRATPPLLAIPESLMAIGIGGNLMPYLRMPPPDNVTHLLAMLWFPLLWVFMFFPRARERPASDRQAIGTLLPLLVFPLLVPYVYSLVRQPIYLVGRLDVLAQPAYFGLLAIACCRLQHWLSSRFLPLASLVPVAVALTLGFGSLAPAYRWHELSPPDLVAKTRDAIFASQIKPDDVIVCMGQEGAKASYLLVKHGLSNKPVTFPLDSNQHLGWFNAVQVALRDRGAMQRDADTIIEAAGNKRIWIVLDPFSGRQSPNPAERNPYTEISQTFMEEVTSRGVKELEPPDQLKPMIERARLKVMQKLK